MTDPQHPQGDLPIPAQTSRRKRVVAREVDADEIEHGGGSPPLEAAIVPVPEPERPPSFESDAVLVIPTAPGAEAREERPEPPDTTPVLDPTLLGHRHRRSRHHRVYRWTQMMTMLGGLAAGVSVLLTALDEPLGGRVLAGIAAGFGVIAVFLSSRTSLSMRWRGWAVAATVFALVALGMTWVHNTFREREGEDAPTPPIRAKG